MDINRRIDILEKLSFKCYLIKYQQQGFYIVTFLLPQRLQLIMISLQLSTTKGIQKHKIPVKQNKHTAQLTAAHPGLVLTKFGPINEHLLQG